MWEPLLQEHPNNDAASYNSVSCKLSRLKESSMGCSRPRKDQSHTWPGQHFVFVTMETFPGGGVCYPSTEKARAEIMGVSLPVVMGWHLSLFAGLPGNMGVQTALPRCKRNRLQPAVTTRRSCLCSSPRPFVCSAFPGNFPLISFA